MSKIQLNLKKKKTRLAMLEHSFDFTVKDNCNSEKIDNK